MLVRQGDTPAARQGRPAVGRPFGAVDPDAAAGAALKEVPVVRVADGKGTDPIQIRKPLVGQVRGNGVDPHRGLLVSLPSLVGATHADRSVVVADSAEPSILMRQHVEAKCLEIDEDHLFHIIRQLQQLIRHGTNRRGLEVAAETSTCLAAHPTGHPGRRGMGKPRRPAGEGGQHVAIDQMGQLEIGLVFDELGGFTQSLVEATALDPQQTAHQPTLR